MCCIVCGCCVSVAGSDQTSVRKIIFQGGFRSDILSAIFFHHKFRHDILSQIIFQGGLRHDIVSATFFHHKFRHDTLSQFSLPRWVPTRQYVSNFLPPQVPARHIFTHFPSTVGSGTTIVHPRWARERQLFIHGGLRNDNFSSTVGSGTTTFHPRWAPERQLFINFSPTFHRWKVDEKLEIEHFTSTRASKMKS